MNFIEWFTEKAILNNINRIFLYSELGGGKTTALKRLVKNLADNYNDYRLIPIYIDCREIDYKSKVISKQIISKYCWISKSEIKNDDNRVDILRECFFRNEYKYLIILDGTDLLKSDSMEKIYEELENLCYENSALFFIFTNSNEKRFNDKVFKNCDFKKVTLKLLDLYDSSIVENSTDIQNLDYHTRAMLSLPYFYSKYCNYKNDIGKVNEINLIDEYVKEILHIGVRSEGSDEFSYRKTLLKEIIPPLVFDSKNGVIVLQNSAHNEMKTSDLSILKRVKSGDIESKYIISHEIIHSYFCEQHLYNVFEKNKDNFLNLINKKILDDLTLKLLGQRLEITNENRKNTELYKLIDIIRHMDKDKQINYSNALNNLLHVFCLTCTAQLAGFDLSELDLRLCCFIGVDCSGVSFENSICTDECFVPIEPENADIFSISENGRYFITGNKDVLNIRESQTNILIDRLLADEGNDFTYAESWGEDYFYIRQKKNALYITIKDYSIISSMGYDTNDEEDKSELLLENIPQSIKKYGNPCCVENGFALVKTDADSIYGSAYLLFDLQAEKLVSVCKYHIHISVYNIVQDGDEIEFLFKNDGKPLKSICYNENTKNVYRKEYPSVVNKGCEFEEGTKVYFDTDNVDSYVKWYFYKNGLKSYDLSQWFDNNNECNIKISDANLAHYHGDTILHFKRLSFTIEKNGKLFLLYSGNIYIDENSFEKRMSNFPLTFNKYRLECVRANNWSFISSDDKIQDIILNLESSSKRFFCFNPMNINITDDYDIFLGNMVCRYDYVNNKIEDVYCYNLGFTEDYLHTINCFPWKVTIEDAIEVAFNTFEILKIVSDKIAIKNRNWIYAFSCYVTYYCWHYYLLNEVLDEDLSDDYFINGFKHWCFPCDEGVIHYDGDDTWYLRKQKKFRWFNGYRLDCFRNGVHLTVLKSKYNTSYFYQLYDIFKDVSDNIKDNIRIPIYDLKLFNANIENINGLSGVVKNIVERQTVIETYTVEYND